MRLHYHSSYLLSLSFAVSIASLENISGTTAAIDLLIIFQDPFFDAHLIDNRVLIIACLKNFLTV